MTFRDITESTRATIERDLAEAAGRGINGPAAAIVASFEELLADYLALDPDLKRAYPRGDTARIFGTALGQALVRDHGFVWSMLDDAYGTDLVVAKPGTGGSAAEKYTAPLVVVYTRFDDDAPGKLTTFLAQFLA